MASRIASCTCGQLSITVHGKCLGNGICHCLACQSRTGSAFATLGAWPAPFEVKGEATQYVRTGDSGAQFRFNFCPVCGSTVFHTEESTGDFVMVAIGCLSDPDFPAPQDSVYDSRRHHWVTLPESTAVYDKDPE
ncbi:MAG: GFA family protein [Pelagibacterium sp.]|jgi:hypothetical protein|uniref:GFA family protein n=1 Tax=Pelagibacterium sp. TaxID=1967288 RepID=UPI0032EE3670